MLQIPNDDLVKAYFLKLISIQVLMKEWLQSWHLRVIKEKTIGLILNQKMSLRLFTHKTVKSKMAFDLVMK